MADEAIVPKAEEEAAEAGKAEVEEELGIAVAVEETEEIISAKF